MTPRPAAGIQILNLLPVALGVIAVLLALRFFGQVAAPLLAVTLAIILATALNPAARFFERWMPRAAAGLVTVLLVVAGIGLLGALAVPPIISQLSSLSGQLPTSVPELERNINAWIERYPAFRSLLSENSVRQLVEQATSFSTNAARALPNLVTTVLGGLFTAVVTLVMVVFVLSNPVPLVNGALGAVPPKHRLRAARALAQMLRQLGAWGRATVLIMAVTGAVMAVGLMLLGLENWLIFGLLAALGELVPNIGPIVASLPPILFALADDPQKALYVALFALAFQQLESFVLAPFLLGGAGKLHPLSVTVGVLLFGSVFGLVGAFLTVPFLIILKALYQEFYVQDALDIPDAVAMALIGGQVEAQLEREEEVREEIKEARDAELGRQAEQGRLDLAAALDDPKEGEAGSTGAASPDVPATVIRAQGDSPDRS
ncbi:Predicted PurR-regulated permease PerM [Deinococcus reticulitermitis]|uniref:Predicted PurR-regulated permease PerM n=1 Tax=Deinococcus reticulitermitis TaxID=856736 RepID=A0A1H7C0A2_9DEIO|nr:AI-2E family transporter [Deinococcus reticulitermitis]SEJ80040.1 Predicted PurR-regulated permease PerM [Deinococcus reticulitermitis]